MLQLQADASARQGAHTIVPNFACSSAHSVCPVLCGICCVLYYCFLPTAGHLVSPAQPPSQHKLKHLATQCLGACVTVQC